MFKLFWTSPPKKRTTFSSWPFDQRFWAIKNLFAQKIWLSLFFSIFGKHIFVLQRFFACKIFRRFKSWITCHSNCKFSVKRPKWNAKISSFLSNRHDPTYLMNCNEKKVAARMCHFQCHTLLTGWIGWSSTAAISFEIRFVIWPHKTCWRESEMSFVYI